MAAFIWSQLTVINIDNKNVSWAANQHIRMISEGSCDTEDWSNDAENSVLHHSNKLHFTIYSNRKVILNCKTFHNIIVFLLLKKYYKKKIWTLNLNYSKFLTVGEHMHRKVLINNFSMWQTCVSVGSFCSCSRPHPPPPLWGVCRGVRNLFGQPSRSFQRKFDLSPLTFDPRTVLALKQRVSEPPAWLIEKAWCCLTGVLIELEDGWMGRGKECVYIQSGCLDCLNEKSPTVVTALYSVIVVLNWAAKSFYSELFIAVWYLNTVSFSFTLSLNESRSFVFAEYDV